MRSEQLAPQVSSTLSTWFVRHGESGWNVSDLLQGQSAVAPGLTSRGLDDAQRAAESLRGCPATLVVSSDLRRALQTARIVALHLGIPLRTDIRLRERSLGSLEGQPVACLSHVRSGFEGGVIVDPDCAPGGGESVRQLSRRVAGFLKELGNDPVVRNVVLVTHGGVIRAAQGLYAGMPLQDLPWPGVSNGSIFKATWPVDTEKAVDTEMTVRKGVDHG